MRIEHSLRFAIMARFAADLDRSYPLDREYNEHIADSTIWPLIWH
jgi:hypothetical protein